MEKRYRLDGDWHLCEAPLTFSKEQAQTLPAPEAEAWMAQPVPGDIHQGLLAAGRIEEPLIGRQSYDCEWTAQRSWWWRHVFEAPEVPTEHRCDLVLDGLDSGAEVFLNGLHLGSHRNAFRPWVRDVAAFLRPGANTLLIRLSAGVETITEAEVLSTNGRPATTEAQNGRPDRGDARRNHVRKPQYSFGWDWCPKVPTTAIGQVPALRVIGGQRIRHVGLQPERLEGGSVRLRATVEVERLDPYRTAHAAVEVSLTDADGLAVCASQRVLLRSGITYVDLDLVLERPRLWWPVGMGEPHRYAVQVQLISGEDAHAYPEFHYGIRFIELEDDDDFALHLNGQRVFCRGGNWIPPDTIYARADEARYTRLLELAAAGNFNMVRIWGGGRYEIDHFYETCDRLGLMVWQDFMFACAPYPDHRPDFVAEVEAEADYQTRRLKRYASVVLWCGNNECQVALQIWWDDITRAGTHLYGSVLPEAVRRNCPELPYWPGSPYGGEYCAGDARLGDVHHWHECMMHPKMEHRITPERYDEARCRFNSEFGYVGAPSLETLREALGEEPVLGSENWQHHNNVFEKDTVAAGIAKHYADPATLDLAQTIELSGMVQGLMLGHAFDAMRYRADCHGCLFWMYNDCWGETGWTFVDYALRKKIAWWYGRRAFAPLRLILRRHEAGQIRIVLANDLPEVFNAEIAFGSMGLDGTNAQTQSVHVEAPGLQRTEVAVFAQGEADPARHVWFAQPIEPTEALLPALFRAADWRTMALPEDPGLTADWDLARRLVTVQAKQFTHGVVLTGPEGFDAQDNYVSLLPGEVRTLAFDAPDGADPKRFGVRCLNSRLPFARV